MGTEMAGDIFNSLKSNSKTLQMKNYIQHGSISTYTHCINVTKKACELNRKLHLNADEETLIQGAMLHDFYLYDWHNKDNGTHDWHGYRHADTAMKNAIEEFGVDEGVQHIIWCHMWPLNITRVPRTREAWIVCMADKMCSFVETVFKR